MRVTAVETIHADHIPGHAFDHPAQSVRAGDDLQLPAGHHAALDDIPQDGAAAYFHVQGNVDRRDRQTALREQQVVKGIVGRNGSTKGSLFRNTDKSFF